MAQRLSHWPEFGCGDVRELAGAGMSAREIAAMTGAPLASILSAAPDCFGPAPPVAEAPVRTPNSRERADQVRVLQATGMDAEEIATEMDLSKNRVEALLTIAGREGLHRQRQPTRARR